MNRKFRCGRLLLNKDGILKKLDLGDGGGTRFCNWDPIDIDFHDVHQRLIDVFDLNESKYKTSLYNFELKPMNVKKYNNFLQYFQKHGFNSNSTVIYLCVHEFNEKENSMIMINKKKATSTSNSSELTKISTLVNTHSSTTLDENINVNNSKEHSIQQQINSYSNDDPTIIIDLSNVDHLFLEYGFENNAEELINNVRIILSQTTYDKIILDLFEYICKIHTYTCSTIDPLQHHIKESNNFFQIINHYQIQLHCNNLNNIYDICRLIKTLIKSNKNKLKNIEHFSIIKNLFKQFYKNFKILYNKWFEYVERKTENISNTTSSSSSLLSSTNPVPSPTSKSQIQVTSEDNEKINVKTSGEQLQTSSSSIEKLPDKKMTEETVIFMPLLYHLDHLLSLLNDEHLLSFREITKSAIFKLKSLQSNVNLSDHQSIFDARQIILGLRYEYKTRFNEVQLKHSKYESNQELKNGFVKVRKALDTLFASLHQYQMKANQDNQEKKSNFSSSVGQQQHENKQAIQSNKRKLGNINMDNNRQNSISSHTASQQQRKYFKK